jgi:hydroxyethylthiazole kinase
MITQKRLFEQIKSVREKAPLVHNITNFVVMNSSANILLAIGAQPVMAHSVDEVADMVKIADALIINIGTLSTSWVDAMIIAGDSANRKGIPVIFDPVGMGATPFRKESSERILESVKVTVIRGNPSEIMSLAGVDASTRGVDSTEGSDAALDAAKYLAKKYKCVVGATGEVDLITDGYKVIRVGNSDILMTRRTGTGCGLSASIGAFLAVGNDPIHDVAACMAFYGIAGEIAAIECNGPGSFEVNFHDKLYNIREEDLHDLNVYEE